MAFFRTSDGADIYFEVMEGVLPQDTIFIHGNMASRRWWQPAASKWTQKSGGKANGAMIVVEFRGCGKSSIPRGPQDVDMKLFADDFIGLAKSLKRPGPLHLVGHSTGGLIAALMLARSPELFGRAVLLDPVGARGVVFEETMTAAFEKMKTDRELVALVLGSTIHNNDPKSEFFQTIIVEDAFHAAKTVGDGVLRALNGLDTRSLLSEVKHPVLVLHGEHDQLLSMKDSQELASVMKSAQFSVIPGQGHCCNVENPEVFVEITDRFLFTH